MGSKTKFVFLRINHNVMLLQYDYHHSISQSFYHIIANFLFYTPVYLHDSLGGNRILSKKEVSLWILKSQVCYFLGLKVAVDKYAFWYKSDHFPSSEAIRIFVLGVLNIPYDITSYDFLFACIVLGPFYPEYEILQFWETFLYYFFDNLFPLIFSF